MARFDLVAAAPLESRDGTVNKGGMIRNGFVEKDEDGLWGWQRPALGSATPAPISGSGFGLIQHGTTLYGVGAATSGTTTTWTVNT